MKSLEKSHWRALTPVSNAISSSENSARAAREVIENTMLPAKESPAAAELSLYRALFTAAYNLAHERNLWSVDMGLAPPREAPASISPREFYLYVLGGLIDENPALRWIGEPGPSKAGGDGAQHYADSRLNVNLISFDGWKGVAQAEISIIEPSGRETGRTLVAVWDGWKWELKFQPITWAR